MSQDPRLDSRILGLSEEHHDAASMYIQNHRFRNIANSLAKPDLLVNKATLTRFARRPSFESLGSCMAMERKEEEGLSRECSCAYTLIQGWCALLHQCLKADPGTLEISRFIFDFSNVVLERRPRGIRRPQPITRSFRS
jgi:hypothetical protein